MGQTWDPEIDVSVGLARELISSQFPELRPIDVERFGHGWDNAAFLVNGAYIFRFPRRSIAAPLVAIEATVLPLLVALGYIGETI